MSPIKALLKSRRGLRALMLMFVTASMAAASYAAEKQVTFYTSYAYQDGENWRIPVFIHVYEKSDLLPQLVAKGVRGILAKRAGLDTLTAPQKRLFRIRSYPFIVDSESREIVRFVFDQDANHQVFELVSDNGDRRTDRNGNLEGTISLPVETAHKLLQAQSSKNGWLTYRTVSANHSGVGKIRLIEPTGLSIISDIDDTIKITEIPDGEQAVLLNTFFREFNAAPCMAEMYRAFGNKTSFHYVSGGPWQMYEPLSEFLFADTAGFPPGSMHMKNVRTNPFERESYEDLWKLLAGGSGQATYDQKVAQISELLRRFPMREFILIGDSGEHDPEIFRTIRRKFGRQVREIRIRDVNDTVLNNPARLTDVIVIPAHSVTGLDCNN